MSRSGYTSDCDNLELWRGAVESAIHGERGQTLLQALLKALDEMPVKELIDDDLEAEGKYCALGVVGKKYGLPIDSLDPHDYDEIAKRFLIAPALAREIVYENDEGGRYDETPTQRFERMRAWVLENIVAEAKP